MQFVNWILFLIILSPYSYKVDTYQDCGELRLEVKHLREESRQQLEILQSLQIEVSKLRVENTISIARLQLQELYRDKDNIIQLKKDIAINIVRQKEELQKSTEDEKSDLIAELNALVEEDSSFAQREDSLNRQILDLEKQISASLIELERIKKNNTTKRKE